MSVSHRQLALEYTRVDWPLQLAQVTMNTASKSDALEKGSSVFQ